MSVTRPHGIRAQGARSAAAPYSIRAAQRVCDILDLLQESASDVALVRIAEATDLPKSSAFRYLATLESRSYVEQNPETGDYRIGPGLLPLQTRQFDLLAHRARPYMEQLRDEFGETINLGLLDGSRVIYLAIVESPKTMRLAARPRDRDFIHSTALGKAIASRLPDERVCAILDVEGLPRLTERTITDPDAYLDELKTVRDRGYAVDIGENEPDGHCVAVPIRGSRLPLALSLSAPAVRLPTDGSAHVVAALTRVAAELVAVEGGRAS